MSDLSNQKTFGDMNDKWPRKDTKIFLVPAYWEMYGTARIEAKTLEEAILIAENESRLSDFDAEYVIDSFNVDSEIVEERNNASKAD